MQLKISGRHMTVTQPIRDYAEEKLSKIPERLKRSDDLSIEMVIRQDKNPSIAQANHVEITGHILGHTLRVEEHGTDMYEAIDLAVARFERQARKYKTRLLSKRRERGEVYKTASGEEEAALGPAGDIVRSKTFADEILTEDEAIVRMELIGHDFFLFRLDPTGEYAAVYRRSSGDYGLLRMQEDEAEI